MIAIVLALTACEPLPTEDSAGIPAGRAPCDLCGGLCFATWEPNESRQHVEGDVAYDQEPPTSGDHNACWAAWGAHTEQVAAENWVHNLEHGGIVFLHDCPEGTDCSAELTELDTYTATLPEGRWVSSPYKAAPLPWSVVAWEYELELGCFDLDALSVFYETHVGRGPEDTMSAPSAACM